MPETFPHFVRIDRDGCRAGAHHVVHAHDPRFTLELTPDPAAPDRIGRGIIRRIRVPNSWAGDYGRYGPLLQAAQEFFAQANPPDGWACRQGESYRRRQGHGGQAG